MGKEMWDAGPDGRLQGQDGVQRFGAAQFTEFLGKVEKLKSAPRHCVTADGVQENVAGHSWRAALMAYLMKNELEEVDINKVIRMCLVHDIGEAVTGDIPTFEKNEAHERTEKEAVDMLLAGLPLPLYRELTELFAEMEALESREAKVYKAIDKLEAVIQHNESDIRTWLPLEYDLQQTYAAQNVLGFPFLEKLQEEAVARTKAKIAAHAGDGGTKAEEPGDGASPAGEGKEGAVQGGGASLAEGKNNWRMQRDAVELVRGKLLAKRTDKQERKRRRQEERARQKQSDKELRQQEKQKKRQEREVVRSERMAEVKTLLRLAEFVTLAVFIFLAVDQAGLYGFLFVWLFAAALAVCAALVLLGILRSVAKKRSGIIFLTAIAGILICTVWFIFLVSSQGLGLGPVPN